MLSRPPILACLHTLAQHPGQTCSRTRSCRRLPIRPPPTPCSARRCAPRSSGRDVPWRRVRARQRLLFHRRAVMAGAAEARHAPSLNGARDHREWPRLLLDAQRLFYRRRIVAVDDFRSRAERRRLRRKMLPVLCRRDIVALAKRVAVEDGDPPWPILIQPSSAPRDSVIASVQRVSDQRRSGSRTSVILPIGGAWIRLVASWPLSRPPRPALTRRPG